MLRCTAVARVAAGAAKTSTHDVPQLTRSIHRLSLAPQFAQNSLSASLNRSLARAFATKTVVKVKTTKVKPKAGAKTAATKKKAAAKPQPKPKKKAVSKKKPGPKKKKKVVVKKAAPKRKVLSERQKGLAEKKKERDALKSLKETALTEPKLSGPQTAWTVYLSEKAKGSTGVVTTQIKEIGPAFKALSASELEHYNHIANTNKATNEAAYKAWVTSHTPEQIRLANNARKVLQRKLSKTKTGGKRSGRGLSPIKDDRQIKRPSSGYLTFSVDRRNSGDFKNISLGESAKLITQEWKDLSASDKKKYTDLQAADRQRYTREYSSTYGHSPPTPKVAAASA